MRKSITAERFSQMSWLADADRLSSSLLWLLFVVLCAPILSFELILQKNYLQMIPIIVMVVLVSIAGGLYIYHYQQRIIKNRARALALVGSFILLLAATKLGVLLTQNSGWATGTAIAAAVILTIAYDQRFAIGMSLLYCLFACFAAELQISIILFLTMAAGVITSCFSLREIRTRMKLLEVGALAAAMTFITSVALGFWPQSSMNFFWE